MDLGCLDLGCISLCDEKKITNSFAESHSGDSNDSLSSTTKLGKNKSHKDRNSPPSAGSVLKRVTSQIKKPLHRKNSPLNWSPRKKMDSYLKRKIKLLQEAGGMNLTLDETLGDSKPHYCRVEREKIAAREAACKVMEARKAAMVEASWCRILQAARIPNKEAKELLIKAEKDEVEAFEAATVKGVTVYDTPDRPLKRLEIEMSSATGKGSTTHTVRASFETAFEVDKQVAVAVKSAFIRLAHCNSFNKEEFKDLVRKISENPDTQEGISEYDTGSGFEPESHPNDGSNSRRKNRKKLSPQKLNGTKLVNMMLGRLKCLKEEELASLATIVATCGLSAALADTKSHKMQDKSAASRIDYSINEATRTLPVEEPELPSLDKFLVNKLTKLEKEVQEAKNATKAESKRDDKRVFVDNVPDLGSVLVKHSSKLEKEIEEAKKSQKSSDIIGLKSGRTLKHWKSRHLKEEDKEVPSLDKCLVKHVSRLEKEVQEAKNRRTTDLEQRHKENINTNTTLLEREQSERGNGAFDSLDNVLVKHVSKLEKEKMRGASKEVLEVKKRDTSAQHMDTSAQHMGTSAGVLDQILVKHKSRLEGEKTVVASEQPEERNTYSKSRREARERELLEMWGGIGLGNSMKPQVSRLERDKAAWRKAEEEEKKVALLEQ